MDFSSIPIRLAGMSSLLYDFFVYEVPGAVFLSLWASRPGSPISELLRTEPLGYKTKIALFAMAAFLVGVVLVVLGEALVSLLGMFVDAAGARIKWLEDVFAPPEVERKFVLHIFRQVEGGARADVSNQLTDPTGTHGSSILWILFSYYTTMFQDLAEKYRRHSRIELLLFSITTGLLLTAVWGPTQMRLEMALGGIAAALFSFKFSVESNTVAARVVVAGYFRELKRRQLEEGEKD